MSVKSSSVTATTGSSSLMDLAIKPLFAFVAFTALTTVFAFMQNYQVKRFYSYFYSAYGGWVEGTWAIAALAVFCLWCGAFVHGSVVASEGQSQKYVVFFGGYVKGLAVAEMAALVGSVAIALAGVVVSTLWATLERVTGVS